MKSKDKKRSFSGGLVKFAALIFSFLLVIIITQEIFFVIGPIKNLELKLIDERFSQRGEINIKDTADVIILEITQDSYDQIPAPYKTWPWPRFIFANVIKNLENAGVKAVGVDLVMSNPDRMSPRNDSLLSNIIRDFGNVVVAGKIDLELESNIQAYREGRIKSLGIVVEQNYDFENLFYHADSSIGIVQTPGDFDEVYRRYQPYIPSSLSAQPLPSFGFALINKYLGLPPDVLAKKDKKTNTFVLGSKKIPAYDATTMLINFYGADRTFPRVEFTQVLDDSNFVTELELMAEEELNEWELIDQSRFKDKIVIIGSSMPEDKDFFNIAFSRGEREGDNILAGVEFHANAMQNILWDDYIYRQPQWQQITLIFLLMIVIFYASSYLKQKKRYHSLMELLNLIVVIVIGYGIYELSIFLFINNKLLVPIVSPFLGIIVAYFSVTAYHFVTERSQNKLIRGMFSTYVSKELVNQLLADPDKLKLGGEKRNLTVLFSDIAGFTGFSEILTPEELVEFINEYLSSMTDVVQRNKGTLDKYIGDAVMAFWGAPIEIERREYLACKTALEMQEELLTVKEKWEKYSGRIIQVRIGVNSGDVVVGNIGGVEKFDYTVMGDNVNLASRLEGANKQYGTFIMISESTYSQIKNEFVVRELDTIMVKGRSKPTKVFELIGYKSNMDAVNKLNSLSNYFNGLKEYKSKNFQEAFKYFEKSFGEDVEDYPSRVYMERCEYYLDNPPDEDWQGAFVMKTK